MKAFIVEGANWQQRIEINDSLYEKYSDMATEAMTQAIERINSGEAENLIKGQTDEMLGVGPVMMGWGENEGAEKIVVLTEYIFRNAGCPEAADAMKSAREAR